MADVKIDFKRVVCAALKDLYSIKGIPFENSDSVVVQTPPNAEMGDLGCPLFVFSKSLKMSPQTIAGEVLSIISLGEGEKKLFDGIRASSIGEFIAAGPYINVKLNKSDSARKILSNIKQEKSEYGCFNSDGKRPFEGRRVMVEYSSPNTNKPLHLGHMRNDALGESVSRILQMAGAEVFKVDLINNRGVHICKSMLAYKLFHEAKNETPESLGMKGDHFVGQCYIEFDRYSKEHPEVLQQAEEMLVQWEAGNPEVIELWKKMNDWTMEGVKQTYERTGISFDQFYFESETYLLGREIINDGLSKEIFFKAEDGSVRIDVTDVVGKGKEEDSHEKVLLRKDGTSVYITQDIGTAIKRHEDWNFNQLVYVVASEQIYHFKILFHILKKLGYDWADRLFHLSYGLVNLPNGRMKSREGTIVDADDLIDSLRDNAIKAINERERDEEVGDVKLVAEKVAIAALHYYLLQANPAKDMIFNPEESLSFNGNTGPYLQYMGARIDSILRKAETEGISIEAKDEFADLLTSAEEWELIKALGDFPQSVEKAAETLDSSIIASYLYNVSRLFSRFYQNCPILNAEDKYQKQARLYLAECTLTVIKNAMHLLLIPFVPKM